VGDVGLDVRMKTFDTFMSSLLDNIRQVAIILNGDNLVPRPRPMPKGVDDDELYAHMGELGITKSGGYVLSDGQARDKMNIIMECDASASVKFDLLHMLDVEVQNKSIAGMASPVMNEIAANQYELIKQMEAE
jgi:hypothetical protein